MNQIVLIKDRLEILPPPVSLKSSQYKFPSNWVVVARCRRPWPNHVRMNEVEKQVWILAVQAQRLSVDQRLNLLLNRIRHSRGCETGASRERESQPHLSLCLYNSRSDSGACITCVRGTQNT